MNIMDFNDGETIYYSTQNSPLGDASKADPVTTEVLRAALNSAANQMKNTLIRTAFSPIIYEARDFAVALYDRNIRMLAQAPTLPVFMGTMNFCVEAAVKAVGGVDSLRPGDMIIYNQPYGTGSHAQDCALVAPVFFEDELIGYACNKAHWLDIGAKSTYCTDTTDVFQEGVVIPGIKILKEGEFVEDTLKFILANCRLPEEIKGDINAQIASNNIGIKELTRIVERFGQETFECCIERMFDHGEKIARSTLDKIPDGRYVARGKLDDNGLDKETVPFELVIEIIGTEVVIDLTGAPDANKGPVNCPFPSTVSMIRVTLASIVGAGEAPNEGHFRPIKVKSRPGSLFHPVSPQPCYLYGWTIMPGMEAVFEALSKACPELIPAGNTADNCSVQFWGYKEDDKTPFMVGSFLPTGQGAHINGDGATLYVPSLAFSHLTSAELIEAKFPMRFDKWEFREDSAGIGEYRGGLGWSYHWTALCDGLIISVMEQTKSPSFGACGGQSGDANSMEVEYPDGATIAMGKVTDDPLPKGSKVRIETGGGGGYGPPSNRRAEAVLWDLREGVISEENAYKDYPQAFHPK